MINITKTSAINLLSNEKPLYRTFKMAVPVSFLMLFHCKGWFYIKVRQFPSVDCFFKLLPDFSLQDVILTQRSKAMKTSHTSEATQVVQIIQANHYWNFKRKFPILVLLVFPFVICTNAVTKILLCNYEQVLSSNSSFSPCDQIPLISIKCSSNQIYGICFLSAYLEGLTDSDFLTKDR